MRRERERKEGQAWEDEGDKRRRIYRARLGSIDHNRKAGGGVAGKDRRGAVGRQGQK